MDNQGGVGNGRGTNHRPWNPPPGDINPYTINPVNAQHMAPLPYQYTNPLQLLERGMAPNPRYMDESISQVDGRGYTSLHTAVENRWEYAVTKLLEDEKWKEMLMARENYGRTPLHVCCDENCFNENIAKTLLKYGADANATDDFGWAPLHVAEKVETVKLLLEEGKAFLNKRTLYRGATPLHMAADRGGPFFCKNPPKC